MRHVFRNAAEVAHVWASQSQDNGRCSNMFFEGMSIYSYGHYFEIARMVNGVVLFTTLGYSVTTAKHKRLVRGAVSHLTIYTVDSMTDHGENVRGYIQRIERGLDKLKKSRSRIRMQISSLHGLVKEMQSYAAKLKKEVNDEDLRAVRKWVHIADSGFIGKKTLGALLKTAAKVEAGVQARRAAER